MFQQIKKKMLQSKLIRYFNSNLLLIMKTDVSNYMTTIILSQKNESLTFMLKKMTVTEQNYEITEKEILTIV